MKNTIDIIQTAVALFFAFGGGTWLAKELKVKASTERNENIKTALTFASQYVLDGQAFFGSGKVQQQHALAMLRERLENNDLAKKFTDDQLIKYIEQAYTELKANGQLAQVSPLVSDEDLAEAEAVINKDSQKEV